MAIALGDVVGKIQYIILSLLLLAALAESTKEIH